MGRVLGQRVHDDGIRGAGGNRGLARWQAIEAGDITPRLLGVSGDQPAGGTSSVMILLVQFVRLQTRTMLAERRTRRTLEDEIATSRLLESRILHISEEERRRLGAHLHDGCAST
jgi:signal transduction histidine kinase